MRRSFSLPSALAVLALAAACSTTDRTVAPAERTSAEPLAAAEQAPLYMVSFRDDVADVRAVARELGARGGFQIENVREFAGRGFDAVIPPAFIDEVRNDPRVTLVERDGPVQLVLPRADAQGPTAQATQTTPWGITRVGGAGDGTGKTAWIIDTGIDLDNPDLNTSKACHANFTNGRSADDGNGHGTHVAGTIAAKDNALDVVGVAANAYVCAVRVLGNSGSGQWSWVVNGINYVAANGKSGDVANMSLGGGANSTVDNAVKQASSAVKFALAAGNEGDNANNHSPARVNGANIYTVSAIDSKNCMPSWSNYGNPPVDYAAPGVSILSLRRGGGTTTMSGTSMATPHVAGILLLGGVRADGSACNDPDGNPDPIAHR